LYETKIRFSYKLPGEVFRKACAINLQSGQLQHQTKDKFSASGDSCAIVSWLFLFLSKNSVSLLSQTHRLGVGSGKNGGLWLCQNGWCGFYQNGGSIAGIIVLGEVGYKCAGLRVLWVLLELVAWLYWNGGAMTPFS